MSYMNNSCRYTQGGQRSDNQTMSIGGTSSESSTKTMGKRTGKRPGRKPSKIDERAKLERSRQSARECRARKKLRYQYLEELVLNREKAVFALRDELESYKQWCSQLDHDEQIPESLLKMISNEEVMIMKKQMEQARRSMVQQQQYDIGISSTSSSSSESSSPPQREQSEQQSQRETRGEPSSYHQSISTQPSTSSLPQSHHRLELLSQHHQLPSQHQQQRQQQHHHPLEGKQSSVAYLQRQVAFDSSQSEENKNMSLMQQPLKHVPKQILHAQQYATSSPNPQTQFNQQQKEQNEKWLQHQQHQQRIENACPTTLHHYNLPQQQSQRMIVSFSSKSEPAFKYEQSSDRPRVASTSGLDNLKHAPSCSFQGNETKRTRSLSNPASMISLTRSNTSSTQSLPDSSQALQDSKMLLSQQRLGLFTGDLIRSSTQSLSLNMPTSVTIEDSSSSDENVNEQQLFISTVLSKKRSLSNPSVHGNPKRSTTFTNVSSPASTASNYDLQTKLRNLTTVHCFSNTRTSNTPSPSSFGYSSYGVFSPTSTSIQTRKTSSTTSSSASASPAPPSSISSILELSASSPGMSSTFYPDIDIAGQSTLRHIGSSSNLDSSHCSTSLSASIDEPIPELYSFLDDLAHGSMSSLSSRHGAISNPSTPMALTPKPQDQPSTPDQSFTNVPKIIHEYLDSDDDDI